MTMATPVLVADFIKRLKKLAKSYDTESAHAEADEILCSVLRELGQKKLIDAYEKVPKWYA